MGIDIVCTPQTLVCTPSRAGSIAQRALFIYLRRTCTYMTDADRLAELVDTADGESVTTDVLQRELNGRPLYSLLEDSERPQYFLAGSMLDIIDESVPESDPRRRRRKVAGSGASLLTVVTDRRLLVLIPRSDDVERLHIPLGDVVAADAESAPGGNHRLSVRVGDTSYRIDTSRAKRAETDSASEYIDAAESIGDRTRSDATDGIMESLDALERLADLRDRGALTDREFEKMKAEILE